jgi:hypothetical protein
MSDFYVYQHSKKDTNEIFYVGKGFADRINKKANRSEHWKRVVNKHGVVVKKIVENLNEEFAYFIEQELIDIYRKRGITLINQTSGGAGNFRPSEEVRKKMSLAKIGKQSPRKGVVLSSEQKQKLSISGKHKPRRTLRKLNSEQVKEIWILKGKLSQQKIGEKYNVTKRVIFNIFHGNYYVEE